MFDFWRKMVFNTEETIFEGINVKTHWKNESSIHEIHWIPNHPLKHIKTIPRYIIVKFWNIERLREALNGSIAEMIASKILSKKTEKDISHKQTWVYH